MIACTTGLLVTTADRMDEAFISWCLSCKCFLVDPKLWLMELFDPPCLYNLFVPLQHLMHNTLVYFIKPMQTSLFYYCDVWECCSYSRVGFNSSTKL